MTTCRGAPDQPPADAPQFLVDYHAYYKTPRGFHKRAGNSTHGWNTTSSLSWLNTNVLQFANEAESPVMVVHGRKAHSRYMSKDAFAQLQGENKELVIIPPPTTSDLFDGAESRAFPFDKIERFFSSHLGARHD